MTTPETTSYLILGYFVFSTVMLIYLASLVIRQRNLQQDLETLKDLEEKQ